MAKWQTRRPAKPLYMGSNPIPCSKHLRNFDAIGTSITRSANDKHGLLSHGYEHVFAHAGVGRKAVT